MNRPLITAAELDQVAKLEAERPEDQEIGWLCRLVRNLARLKPTDEQFPEHLVLLNHHAMNGFNLQHVERVFFPEQEMILSSPDPFITAMTPDHRISCKISDAVLFVRPYVRLLEPTDQAVLDRLEREGTATIYVNGESLFRGGLADILVGFDGYGVRRAPMRLHTRSGLPGFEVGVLRGDGKVDFSNHGVFLANAEVTRLEIAFPVPPGQRLRVTTGFVMGLYTSRGSGAYVPYPGNG